MKKLFIVLLSCVGALSAMAQTDLKTKQKEVGIVFTNLENFGATYRFGTTKALWRISGLSLGGGTESGTPQYFKGATLNFGREFRKPLSDRLDLRYGADLSLSYTSNKYEVAYESSGKYLKGAQRNRFYTPGVKLVFGVNYKINDHLLFGAEVNPGFSYTVVNTENRLVYDQPAIKSSHYYFNYNILRSTALLSLVCKF